MTQLYYLPPPDMLFNEMKAIAIVLWTRIADVYETPDRIRGLESMQNIGDNFMTILAQFDGENQHLAMSLGSSDLKSAVRERIISVNGYSDL